MSTNIRQKLLDGGHIPYDKSWIIRMGILDLVHGSSDNILAFLSENKGKLSDDLAALGKAVEDWVAGKEEIFVGESATLYRDMMFMSWVNSKPKKFICAGTLVDRDICKDPTIINLSLQKLLKLDNRTSQWASASVLMGNPERIDPAPFKLRLTFEAVEHWKAQRKKHAAWVPRYDDTMLEQAVTFLRILKYGYGNFEMVQFTPQQAEDYCFARALGYMTQQQGLELWPSLTKHETNRIEEMETVVSAVADGDKVVSVDHRAIQAGAMLAKALHKQITFENPSRVSKSWPQFWKFMSAVATYIGSNSIVD